MFRYSVATDDVDTMKDEDLQAVYLTASMTTSATNPCSTTTEKSPKSPDAAGDGEKTGSVAEKKAPKQLVLKSR